MVGPAVAVGGVLVLLQPSPGSAVTFSNACINSAVPTAAAQLNVTLTGNAPASVQPGGSFQLTNISQTLALPGTIFVAGYNLGRLVVGTNEGRQSLEDEIIRRPDLVSDPGDLKASCLV